MTDLLKKISNSGPSSWGHRPFLLAVLFFSLFLAYLILKPFFNAIILAIIMASLFHPIKQPLLRLYRGRKSLVALTAVVIITFLILIPALFFISALVSQGIETVSHIEVWIRDGNLQKLLDKPQVAVVTDWIRKNIDFLDYRQSDLQDHVLRVSKGFGQFVLERGASVVSNLANMVFGFFVIIFISFYLVRDGEEMLKGVQHLSPLPKKQEDYIIKRVKAVARSALLGSFLTALCQGLAGGIAFAFVGIPALFWGTVLGFSSLIPVVGTALVWIPASGYLALIGQWKSAIFLFLWCLIIVGSIDNFLRPFLMRGEGQLSPFYIFLAIIGGVKYFGLSGLLYGPLILGLASVMLYIYQVEYDEQLSEESG